MAQTVTKKISEKELKSFNKNHAGNNTISDRFFAHVSPIVDDTRKNRVTQEQQWLDDQQKWSCLLDEKGYVGRSNIFVPELNEQVEVSVEKALAATFASPDFIYAVPKNISQEKADKIRNAVLYELEERNSAFTLFDEHERQKVLFGTSIMKGGFMKDVRSIWTRNSKGQPIKTEVPRYWGTKWDVVDIFRWYIFPETSNLDNCYLTFEDQLVDTVQEKKSKLYVGLDDLPVIRDDMEHKWVDLTRRDFLNLGSMLRSRPNAAIFTEVWMDYDLYDDGDPVPVLGVIANYSKVVRLVRNPYWNQTHPYVGARYVKRLGKMYYGLSLPDKIRSQQDQMNDTVNQTMDSMAYSLAPIAVIDPALAGDINSMKLRPGAKWMGSPAGIDFKTFPDVSGSGLRLMQEIRGQVQQFSDNASGVAPQLSGKARSATQASIVAASISIRQKVQLKREEDEVLKPMCANTHMLLLQFMDKDWQIKCQGPDAGSWVMDTVKPDDIIGEVDFQWKGAEQAEKTAVRSQQLLGFYNMALQTASIMPGEVDLPVLFRRIAKEAFDLRDMDEVFKSLRDMKTVDPAAENVALMDEEDLPVNMGDNDEEHIKDHEPLLDDKKLSDEAKLMVLRHIEKHKVQKRGKDQILQAKGRLQAMQMVAQQGPGGPGGGASDGRSGPQVSSPMEGNQGQMSTSPAAIMSGVRGVQP